MLFSLYLEPLTQVLRHLGIGSYQWGSLDPLIILYSDDIILTLGQPLQQFPLIMEIIDRFGFFSGYKINKSKTQSLIVNAP